MFSADHFINSSYDECVFCHHDPQLNFTFTNSFNVICDPFALTPGHLLITSKNHYGCLGELPSSVIEENKELKVLIQKVLTSIFGSYIRYEHGRAGHCLNKNPRSRLCHHYHEHWLPIDIDIHPILAKKFRAYPFQDEKQIPELYEKYGHYLLFENSKGEKTFYAVNQKIPSHLIRTLIANELGFPERQNWETYTSCELMLQGKALLKSHLKNFFAA